MFSTHFSIYWLKCTNYSLDIHVFSLKCWNTKLHLLEGLARKAYILKFRHIELGICGDIHFKILGQCTWTSWQKDPRIGFVRI